jgi:hypothetical protein
MYNIDRLIASQILCHNLGEKHTPFHLDRQTPVVAEYAERLVGTGHLQHHVSTRRQVVAADPAPNYRNCDSPLGYLSISKFPTQFISTIHTGFRITKL